MALLEIYTDGASNVHGNPPPGGWAAVFVLDGALIDQAWAGVENTTNQRMEMCGVIEGLNKLLDSDHDMITALNIERVVIVLDSGYVYEGMTQKWYVKWRTRNWENSEGTPVKNRDLWELLIENESRLKKEFGITLGWKKIRGHQGDMYNEVADKLAVKGKKSVQ